MSREDFSYIPGVCNIDSKGVAWRKKLTFISFIAGVISLTSAYYFHYGPLFRFIIGAGFGYAASLNFLQAREHFCVMNASKRTYETALHKMKIADDRYKDMDMKKRRSIIGRS